MKLGHITSHLLLLTCVMLAVSTTAQAEMELIKGQTIYVPVYSHIYHGNKEQRMNLAVTLSIRNTSPNQGFKLLSVKYFDSDGKFVRDYTRQAQVVSPLASKRFVVKESDVKGGSGASFLVKWQAENKLSAPIVESIMISTMSTQGISFRSSGRVIEEISN